MLYEAEITSLNPFSPSCVDMSQKIKKKKKKDLVDIAYYSVRTPIDYSFTQTESITVVVFCGTLFFVP
jgi:hypothetical protein